MCAMPRTIRTVLTKAGSRCGENSGCRQKFCSQADLVLLLCSCSHDLLMERRSSNMPKSEWS